MARVFGLAEGIDEVNTLRRLEEASRTQALSKDMGANLRDAFELIGTLRVQHQVRQIRNGDPPDNYLSPDELSALERSHLKDAFSLIASLQETLEQRYMTTRFS
jgi:CBS domain-containing protein